jgi:DNA-3-methyladenine glycosylase I
LVADGPFRSWCRHSKNRQLKATIVRIMTNHSRCTWCGTDPIYCAYHDEEWGVPLHDERALFEFLVLEGAQAGLSWLTILKKREGYRRAFDDFDAERIARYGETDVARLMADTGIVRNRLKIESTITNARATLALRETVGGLDAYFWNFVDGRPIDNAWKGGGQVPASTPLSDTISKDLKKRGFKFVGSTIVYAHMQATGMVNDHTVDCFRHREVAGVAQRK